MTLLELQATAKRGSRAKKRNVVRRTTLTFRHIPLDRALELGPFEWVTMTYGEMRAKSPLESEDGHTVASFIHGIWVTEADGAEWTDVDFTAI